MMEQLQDSKEVSNQQAENTAEQSAISVGRLLREGRERMGWSVEDVVSQIKLAPRQIEALEADDFKSLPETAFVRGFVRSYAKVLQLDAQPLLAALPGAKVTPEKVVAQRVEADYPSASPERQQNMNLLVAAFLLALLIAGFAAWQANTSQPLESDSVNAVSESALVSTPVELPVQEEVAATSEVSASDTLAASAVLETTTTTVPSVENKVIAKPGKLRLVFDKESWTEVTEQSGKVLARKVYQPGEELNVEGIAPFSLVIGHATQARLYYQGKQVDMTPYINSGSEVARLTLE